MYSDGSIETLHLLFKTRPSPEFHGRSCSRGRQFSLELRFVGAVAVFCRVTGLTLLLPLLELLELVAAWLLAVVRWLHRSKLLHVLASLLLEELRRLTGLLDFRRLLATSGPVKREEKREEEEGRRRGERRHCLVLAG